MAKATSRLRLPHTFQQLRRQDLSSRMWTLRFAAPANYSAHHLLSTHATAIVRRKIVSIGRKGRFRCYKTTKVHRYFSRNKINEPTKTQIPQVSLCRSPTSHALIIPQQRHAHERTPLKKNGKKQEKGVRSYGCLYRKRKHVFWVRRGATCTLPAALSSCIFSRIMASQPPDLSG
jgi:hypothetical protein